MSNYLVNHALSNVWCTPEQDKQFILRLAKVTPDLGVWINFRLQWRSYELPNNTQRFHIYQIGQLYPEILGLFLKSNKWVQLQESCNVQKMLIDLYSDKGYKVPNHIAYYRFTPDNNLIIAIPEESRINIRYQDEAVYMKVYTNAYFQSIESDQLNDYIEVGGKKIATMVDILTLQNKVNQLRTQPGQCLTFVNGVYTSHISPILAAIGDFVEYVYDSSIHYTFNQRIGDLPSFMSTLDNTNKFLLHFSGVQDNHIEYLDDVSFYLYRVGPNGNHRGVYYHKNRIDAVRMITNHDYAILVDNVQNLAQSIPGMTNPEDLRIVVYVRKSGYNRSIIQEANRLHELYKLSDADVVEALIGFDANVSVWHAPHLEASAYIRLMGMKREDVTPQVVEEAYGYNSISRILGNTPVFTEMNSGVPVVNLPVALQNNSAVFEYNAAGHLLEVGQHLIGEVYGCENTQTRLVEVISGVIDTGFDEYYTNVVNMDPAASYRFYAAPIFNSVVGQWEDVTGSPKYVVVNNVATWVVDLNDFKVMVRSDKKLLVRTHQLAPYHGVLQFTLTQTVLEQNGLNTYPMTIPPGELDIFVNRKSLIKDIDYVVDFPKIAIISKKHLTNIETDLQEVVIRAKGFCDAEFKLQENSDAGFVKHNLLSGNNRFDIRDDKVLRIVVGGALYERSELKYYEDATVGVSPAENGLPYSIRDIVVPMRGLTVKDTYVLRAEAELIDKEISDYLTAKLPERVIDETFVIPERYFLYSPVCSNLIMDMINGVFTDDRIYENYTDLDVLDIMTAYAEWLVFDPCMDDRYPDQNYTYVHPHIFNTVVSLDPQQYKFVARAIELVLKNRVELSHFVTIAFN